MLPDSRLRIFNEQECARRCVRQSR